MLNPLHLRTFIVVLRTGSFAEAARSLGYTSSAVSQQIQPGAVSKNVPLRTGRPWHTAHTVDRV